MIRIEEGYYKNEELQKDIAMYNKRARTTIWVNLGGFLREQLLLSICPAFTYSLLPVLEVADTFTDVEPGVRSQEI